MILSINHSKHRKRLISEYMISRYMLNTLMVDLTFQIISFNRLIHLNEKSLDDRLVQFSLATMKRKVRIVIDPTTTVISNNTTCSLSTSMILIDVHYRL